MPNLGGGKKKLDLSSSRHSSSEKSKPASKSTKKSAESAQGEKVDAARRRSLLDSQGDDFDDESEEDDDDSVIEQSLNRKREGTALNFKFIGLAALIVICLIVFFLVGKSLVSKQPQEEVPVVSSSVSSTSEQVAEPEQTIPDSSLGTQDFTQDTTMTSDSELTDASDFTKDLYGLTTRVDYTVASIQNATDFVSYTKYRGTWGGGLELYYLECEYKESKYVIQVPFKYYKELDDTGIVPVKMEVLRIVDNSSSTGYLTIVSYMCLDEATLAAVLKTQNK